MEIRLARVDDRLIHGQITTVWSKRANVGRIIVVDDKVSKDTLRKALLEQAAPPGIKVHVLDVDRFVRIYNNPKYEDDKVLVLFENVDTAKEVLEKGVKFGELNIGGVSFQNGRTTVTNAISLTKAEADILRDIVAMGVTLDSRVVTTDARIDLLSVIDRIEFK